MDVRGGIIIKGSYGSSSLTFPFLLLLLFASFETKRHDTLSSQTDIGDGRDSDHVYCFVRVIRDVVGSRTIMLNEDMVYWEV